MTRMTEPIGNNSSPAAAGFIAFEYQGAQWHRESYDRFLKERLPELLADRLPLAGYNVEFPTETTARVTVTIAGNGHEVSTVYDPVRRPNAEGIVPAEGENWPYQLPRVVLPRASGEDLASAEIKCIGELLADDIAARLGEAGEGLPWDEALLRAWLPLDAWIDGFIASQGQTLDVTNGLSQQVHLRRIVVWDATLVTHAGQTRGTCPLETPEGPNVNKFRSVGVGATIRDGRLVLLEDVAEASFGLSASMIPFIEHSSDARLMMGCNMLRQWSPLSDPEPAFVQTGCELDLPGFWSGRNLLTAYVPWGENTYEDSVVISESCAQRFRPNRAFSIWHQDGPDDIEVGDFLSNRHGAKCTVSRILPDDEMPHLNGVPSDIVYSPSGVSTRLNLGQLWEAAAGRIAHATGEAIVTPPFHGPSQANLRASLSRLGLPEDGLDRLTLGKDGPALDRPSCVGWVYWGRHTRRATDKVVFSIGEPPTDSSERIGQGIVEFDALRRIGALETIREHFNARSARNPSAAAIADRLAAGRVEQAAAPSPAFAELTSRLALAGIDAGLSDGRIIFSLREPADPLRLARPVSHPWLRDRSLNAIEKHGENAAGDGSVSAVEAAYGHVAKANTQLERLLRSSAPERLLRKGTAELEAGVAAYFEALVAPDLLRWNEAVIFAGRARVEPGDDLRPDEIMLPEEMAWGLFAPCLRRVLDESEIAARSARAVAELDSVMASTWMLLYSDTLAYQPEYVATPFLAVHARRGSENVIRIHNGMTALMNMDYDGDIVTVFLPVTEEGQREAGEKLTLQAYMERDPGLLPLMPAMDSLWGLASLSLREDGREELSALLGGAALPPGLLTKTTLRTLIEQMRERDGSTAALEILERLRKHGFEAARRSGWSIGPFPGYSLEFPAPPQEAEWLDAWPRYAEEVADLLSRKTTFEDNDLDPARLSVLSGARGSMRHLLFWTIGVGSVADLDGRLIPSRSGLVEGLTAEESALRGLGTRNWWYRDIQREMALGSRRRELLAFGAPPEVAPRPTATGHHVLARAMRAQHPGAVFARAAALGESDPLTDLDSRLFVGLAPA